jgi:hypothetical protein
MRIAARLLPLILVFGRPFWRVDKLAMTLVISLEFAVCGGDMDHAASGSLSH